MLDVSNALDITKQIRWSKKSPIGHQKYDGIPSYFGGVGIRWDFIVNIRVIIYLNTMKNTMGSTIS